MSNWCNGRNFPNNDTVNVICKSLGINPEYLYIGNKEKYKRFEESVENNDMFSEEEIESLARTVYHEPRLAHDDAVLLYPLIGMYNICDISSRVIDCDDTNYVNRFFRNHLKDIQHTPEGRHVVRILKSKCSPLVEHFDEYPDDLTEAEDAKAYWDAKKKWLNEQRQIHSFIYQIRNNN